MFTGWVEGAGTPAGYDRRNACRRNRYANRGGRNRAYRHRNLERQIARWMAQAFGLPMEASGIFVTGASMADFLSLLVARDQACGPSDVRLNGLRALIAQLIGSRCLRSAVIVRQAMELAGLGARTSASQFPR